VANLTSAAGAAQWSYAYEPFGTIRAQTDHTGSAPVNLMRFTGEPFDEQTGLYHLRARQYDPGTGRFLSTDPWGQSLRDPGVASYPYVTNRPTFLIDPTGLRGESTEAEGIGACGLPSSEWGLTTSCNVLLEGTYTVPGYEQPQGEVGQVEQDTISLQQSGSTCLVLLSGSAYCLSSSGGLESFLEPYYENAQPGNVHPTSPTGGRCRSKTCKLLVGAIIIGATGCMASGCSPDEPPGHQPLP
jgi:RHS repeat-associated protein